MTLNLCRHPIGTRLKTRDGRSARLLATDVRGEYQCVVSVESRNTSDDVYTVRGDGRHAFDEEGDRDIVGIEKPKHRVRVQIVRHAGRGLYYFATDPATKPGHTLSPGEVSVADQIVEIEETGDA